MTADNARAALRKSAAAMVKVAELIEGLEGAIVHDQLIDYYFRTAEIYVRIADLEVREAPVQTITTTQRFSDGS